MRTCPRCQVNYPDETEFCPRDGSALPSNLTAAEARLAAALATRFRILRRLGSGGMGTVFLAEQVHVGHRRVAVKIVHRRLLDDPEFLIRFRNEAASTGRIHHPNVVTVYESGEGDDGTPYLAMEYLEGKTLGELLRQQSPCPSVTSWTSFSRCRVGSMRRTGRESFTGISSPTTSS